MYPYDSLNDEKFHFKHHKMECKGVVNTLFIAQLSLVGHILV